MSSRSAQALRRWCLLVGTVVAVGCSASLSGPAVDQLVVFPNTISVPAAPAVFTDGFRQLTATVLDRHGSPVYHSALVWGTSDASVATVSQTGLVAGEAPGRAVIRASANGRVDSAVVDVVPAADPELMIIAHHGFAFRFPENTVDAIDSAFARGADGIELDVQVTKDGVAILMHDDTVDRTTDGTGAVKELTYAQISGLNACAKFKPQWPPCSVPTLSEALQAAKGRGLVIIDLKARLPNTVLASILADVRTADMEHSVMYVAFDYPMLQEIRRLAPMAPLGHLTMNIPQVDAVKNLGRAAALPNQKALRADQTLSLAFLESARRSRVDVGTWTVTNVQDAKALVALGVRRLISDIPLNKGELLP